MGEPTYTFAARPEPAPPPVLDEHQRAVTDHRAGPMLVLAGPGTGKTTTLVEAVAARVTDAARPLPLERALVLTFSRKAADELRARITARLGRTTAEPVAWTFHAFCYALVRAHQPADLFSEPLRLLTGPEQEVVVRELLRGGDARRWPEALRGSLGLRGFAEEVRSVLARSRELGMEPEGLRRLAERAGRPEWTATAAFFHEYLDVLDAQGAVDYAELVTRAVALAERPLVQAALRERFAAVFVDEYQDTDPAQERLLQAIAGDGRDLVVVGDPDQSIYAFRGADVTNILEFPHRFPCADGAPAPTRTLRRSRRSGAALLAASRAVATRLPMPSQPGDVVRAHRDLVAAGHGSDGVVEVRTFPSVGAELDAVADALRRAHLHDGVPWREMAVLVRSGVRSVPLVRRSLGSAGVPVEVAGDELPLAHEPAVAPLLLALRCAADPGAALTAEAARTLLLSPLGGADAADLRRLGRALRAEDRIAGAADGDGLGRLPRASAELVREAVAEPERLVVHDPGVAAPARRLGRLLRSARAVLDGGGTPEEALWALWSGTRWPSRLEAQSRAGGPGGRAADRELDAVCALFDAVARAEERRPRRGVVNLLDELEAQRIPGDTLAERGVRDDAVRVLTAHRAKGLEWDLVVVPGVQEGVWPDLRRRGSLLEADRLGRGGLIDPPSVGAALAEERRLFYVAVTRARRRLVVSAVASADDDGERPSRFLAELGVPVEAVASRPRHPLSVPGLVADLRATAADPAAAPALRRAAVERLGLLAAATADDGSPLVPAADPRTWWGLHEQTDPGRPMHAPGQPVRTSGSSLSGLDECPLRWFLQHEAHAEQATTTALGFGSIVHALAHDLAEGRVPADLDALMARVDRVWEQLAFEARWQSAQQREAARAALGRLLAWAAEPRGRTTVASEHPFEVAVTTPAGPAVLRGSMDRVERDEEGRAVVVDFKTGRTPPTSAEVAQHPQLGVYQLAVRAGALDGLAGLPEHAQSGGAELVQLRRDAARRPGHPAVQSQPPLPEGADGRTWVDLVLERAVRRVVGEQFTPAPNDRCGVCEFRRCCPAQPEGRQVVQ